MRKLLILSIALSVFLCACGSTYSSNADSSKQEGTATTAYSTPENDDPSSSDSDSSQQDSSEPDGSSSEKGSDPSSSETKTTAESKDSSHVTDTSTRTELVTGSIGTAKKDGHKYYYDTHKAVNKINYYNDQKNYRIHLCQAL